DPSGSVLRPPPGRRRRRGVHDDVLHGRLLGAAAGPAFPGRADRTARPVRPPIVFGRIAESGAAGLGGVAPPARRGVRGWRVVHAAGDAGNVRTTGSRT